MEWALLLLHDIGAHICCRCCHVRIGIHFLHICGIKRRCHTYAKPHMWRGDASSPVAIVRVCVLYIVAWQGHRESACSYRYIPHLTNDIYRTYTHRPTFVGVR